MVTFRLEALYHGVTIKNTRIVIDLALLLAKINAWALPMLSQRADQTRHEGRIEELSEHFSRHRPADNIAALNCAVPLQLN